MRMGAFVMIAATLIGTGSPARGQEANPGLVILPLQAMRVDPATVAILDQILTTRVHSHGRYAVVSASDLNAMVGLENMKDALGCDDVQCAAEIGGAIGARFLLSGSVSSLGGQLLVTLTLIDTSIPAVVKRVQSEVRDDETHYRDAVEQAVGRLFGAAPPTAAEQKRREEEEQKRHAQELERRREQSWNTVRALVNDASVPVAKRIDALNAFLKEYGADAPQGREAATSIGKLRQAWLTVTTDPPGALVTIGGKSLGPAPVKAQMPAGEYVVSATLEGFVPATLSPSLAAGQSRSLQLTLKRVAGVLAVVTEPAGAAVFVEGETAGVAPVSTEVAPGVYTVKGTLAGYRDASQTVTIEADQTTSIRLPLIPEPTAYGFLGHLVFWSGVGVAAFGGIAAWQGNAAADQFRGGNVAAAELSRTWAGLMWTGFGVGTAAIATGILLWLHPWDADETTTASLGLASDGRTVAVSIRGGW